MKMIPGALCDSVLALPEKDRLELARRIVDSIVQERASAEAIALGILRVEEVAAGKVEGLSHAAFLKSLE